MGRPSLQPCLACAGQRIHILKFSRHEKEQTSYDSNSSSSKQTLSDGPGESTRRPRCCVVLLFGWPCWTGSVRIGLQGSLIGFLLCTRTYLLVSCVDRVCSWYSYFEIFKARKRTNQLRQQQQQQQASAIRRTRGEHQAAKVLCSVAVCSWPCWIGSDRIGVQGSLIGFLLCTRTYLLISCVDRVCMFMLLFVF